MRERIFLVKDFEQTRREAAQLRGILKNPPWSAAIRGQVRTLWARCPTLYYSISLCCHCKCGLCMMSDGNLKVISLVKHTGTKTMCIFLGVLQRNLFLILRFEDH